MATDAPADTKDPEVEARELLHELQSIRDSLSEHARRHPRQMNCAAAREEVGRAIEIAIRAAKLPYTDSRRPTGVIP